MKENRPAMSNRTQNTKESQGYQYREWLAEIKQKARVAQLKAAVSVNRELLRFYWELGAGIIEKQQKAQWGDGFLARLSRDLMDEFPDIKGFSERNIQYVRKWYLFYKQCFVIPQQPVAELTHTGNSSGENFEVEQIVAQITSIPWGHNLVIISRCSGTGEALFYVQKTLRHNWSRSVLTHQIAGGLWQRTGKAVTNFQDTLPKPQSDLASQMLKDPYTFDFLTLTGTYNERELEKGLVEHLSSFLLELGAGFAYLGKQFPVRVGEREFYLDLLFYHTRLHCYVVVELKTTGFEPEYAGKLNFYLKAVDEQLRQPGDAHTIGILLCRDRDRMVAEYALSDIGKPVGISEYELTQALPEKFQSSLPSIEELEAELSGVKAG